MATSRGAPKANETSGQALSDQGLQGDDAIPARLIEAARDLQLAYDLQLAARGAPLHPWRRTGANKSASLKRTQLQLRLSRVNGRMAKARQ